MALQITIRCHSVKEWDDIHLIIIVSAEKSLHENDTGMGVEW